MTVGPWIKYNLVAVGITDSAAQAAVVRYLIDRFNETLKAVAQEHERFVAIDNRGTLRASEWNDELHPTRNGFKKIARSFLGELHRALATASG